MEQQTHVHGSKMDFLNFLDNDLVVKEEPEKVSQTQRSSTGADRGVAIGEFVDLVEHLRPLWRCLRLPESIRIWHGSTKFCDGEQRCCVVEQREILIDHDPGINEAKAR